jgi:hypothetical protein
MKNYERKQESVSEWTDGSLINEDVINSLTPEQLTKLAEILAKVN